MHRRDFLKTASAAVATLALNPFDLLSHSRSSPFAFWSVHPFIEHNPDAVFIMRTAVDEKTNSEAKKQAGLDFGTSVFVASNDPESGLSTSINVAIKPNLTCRGKWDSAYTLERSMGIITDVYFVEGVIESIKRLGLAGEQFYLREVNCPQDFEDGGYWALAERTGANLMDLSLQVDFLDPGYVQWLEVPDGIWFRNIPYLWPVNAPDTWLLNIAKFKAHAMGLTLCAKNLQGTIANNYQAHCVEYDFDMNMNPQHQNPRAKTLIMENYQRHLADGVPRWDRPGGQGGLWQETWATRCLDNNSVTHPGLNIIEGIYGHDGHFIQGPGPDGVANDFMANIIIFGKNAFHVDVIGHWLGGHEPGNFGLFHMARERGLAQTFHPFDIPVYAWQPDGSALLTPLNHFERTPLKTLYLQRDWDGQEEPLWHLVDEPFDYTGIKPSVHIPATPRLYQNYPNPFNSATTIEFSLASSGPARLDILNANGQVVDVLLDRFCSQGAHMQVWRNGHLASGSYFYRLRTGNFCEIKKMVYLK